MADEDEQKVVRLIDKNLEQTISTWRIIETGPESVRVENTETGQKLRVHKSRVVDEDTPEKPARRPEEKPKMAKKTKFVCETCSRELTTQSGLTLHQKTCAKKGKKTMSKDAATVTAPKAKAKTKEVKESNKKSPDPFDIAAFASDNGSEHWARGEKEAIKFDHPGYKLVTYAVMDEKGGYFYIINTYANNGVISLGKSGKGITKYPLKGKKISYTVSEAAKKQENRGQKRERKGTKTADDIRKHWEKLGYVKKA